MTIYFLNGTFMIKRSALLLLITPQLGGTYPMFPYTTCIYGVTETGSNSGFSVGFRLGFQGPPPSGPERNNLSAESNSEAVSTAILKELNRGHTAGPFETHPLPSFFCSPPGADPRKDGTKCIIRTNHFHLVPRSMMVYL